MRFAPRVPIWYQRGIYAYNFSENNSALVVFGESDKLSQKGVLGVELLDLAQKVTTLFISAARLVSRRPGWLMDFWVGDESGAASMLTLHDGGNTTAPILCKVRVLANSFSHLDPKEPIRCENGLYVTGPSSTIPCGLQFMADE